MFFAFFSKLWSYIVSFLFETGLDEFLRSIDFEGFELVGIAFEEVDTGFGKVEVVREIAYQILIGFALYRWCLILTCIRPSVSRVNSSFLEFGLTLICSRIA